MVVASVQVEASFRLRLRLQSPFYVVEARLQKWEQPRKRRSAVELPVRRVQRGRTRWETARRQEGVIPEDDVMQRGRTRGETARLRGGTGHGLLSLMAARESIGHLLFHQAPPHDNPLLPTHPASELSTRNSYAEARADEYSVIWERAVDKDYSGLANAGTFGEV